jgi:hypothetical protein
MNKQIIICASLLLFSSFVFAAQQGGDQSPKSPRHEVLIRKLQLIKEEPGRVKIEEDENKQLLQMTVEAIEVGIWDNPELMQHVLNMQREIYNKKLVTNEQYSETYKATRLRLDQYVANKRARCLQQEQDNARTGMTGLIG